jgi:arylsulfatase A-like enzyme
LGGYQTHYKGKWHLSDEDILIPGTQNAVLSNDINGNSFPDRIDLYRNANRLEKYGFTGWVGPEPHGQAQANSGTARDPGFADQVCDLLDRLDSQYTENPDAPPFLVVASFVNPHDIVFSGLNTLTSLAGLPLWFPEFQDLVNAGALPKVDKAATSDESLANKPRCQKDYLYTYPRMYFPQPDSETYRQFYYFLMAEVHKHIAKVYAKLQSTRFAENTIVVFTSDHGDLLGSHGGLQQKWYNAYNETLHVPFIISNKHLTPGETSLYTSHVDLLPTLLGLADIDQAAVRAELAKSHSEAQPLVGRDLSGLVTGERAFADEPIYFMTDDNVEEGTQMTTVTGQTYSPIIQPKHVETVITKLTETGDTVWKYSRYFDNPRFWVGQVGNPDNIPEAQFIPDEWECYNLTDDPLEVDNLLSPLAQNPLPDNIKNSLQQVLRQQRQAKRLLPQTLNNQGGQQGLAARLRN